MIHVIVVARYLTIRAGLTALLSSASGINVVAEADEIDRLPDLLDEQHPDVLLIDLVDDAPDGLVLLRELSSGGMLPPIVLLSGSASDALDGLQLPETSLLLRDATGDEIQTALRTASQGLVTMDPRVVREISEQLHIGAAPDSQDDPILLTPRERDVLHLIASGLPNKSIAHDLGISDHTVKFHVGSIFRKLEVSSRSEAIAVAARRGLLVL